MITKPFSGVPAHADLYRSWRELLVRCPHQRARDSAQQLGVSEARLVSARCAHGEGVPLRAEPAPLLARIATLGRVMALTRSTAAVLENIGTYGLPDIGEHTGIVIGDNIDLRIFPSGWKYAYALTEHHDDGVRRSVQVFDAEGIAAHKVFLRPESEIAAFADLTGALATAEAVEPLGHEGPQPARPASDAAIDMAAYRAAYSSMQDTHDFFMLLRRFNLTREAGLRLAGSDFVRPVAATAHRQLFAGAAANRIPLMIFVANSGMVQISSGLVPAPTFAGSWCNLIDRRFNLHVDEAGFERAWAVRKPTVNGVVTSLELYAGDGTLVVQIFGERHAGEGERDDWAAAVEALARPSSSTFASAG